jgi:hypothetical protein
MEFTQFILGVMTAIFAARWISAEASAYFGRRYYTSVADQALAGLDRLMWAERVSANVITRMILQPEQLTAWGVA